MLWTHCDNIQWKTGWGKEGYNFAITFREWLSPASFTIGRVSCDVGMLETTIMVLMIWLMINQPLARYTWTNPAYLFWWSDYTHSDEHCQDSVKDSELGAQEQVLLVEFGHTGFRKNVSCTTSLLTGEHAVTKVKTDECSFDGSAQEKKWIPLEEITVMLLKPEWAVVNPLTVGGVKLKGNSMIFATKRCHGECTFGF